MIIIKNKIRLLERNNVYKKKNKNRNKMKLKCFKIK